LTNVNGRIPLSSLERIHHPSLACYLEENAAHAFEAMRQASLKSFGTDLYPLGAASAYRNYSQQVYFWDLYKAGKGAAAAYPGTSNHGWGKAIDFATSRMWWVLSQLAGNFGWSHAEGLRVHEAWHWVYVGGSYPAPKDPLWFLTSAERYHVREYYRLKAAGSNARKEHWHWLVNQRKEIWRNAKGKKGDKPGWNILRRKQRYEYLLRFK
jgi:hypothetical protein